MLGKAVGRQEFEKKENLEGGETGENKKKEYPNTWKCWEREHVQERDGREWG